MKGAVFEDIHLFKIGRHMDDVKFSFDISCVF